MVEPPGLLCTAEGVGAYARADLERYLIAVSAEQDRLRRALQDAQDEQRAAEAALRAEATASASLSAELDAALEALEQQRTESWEAACALLTEAEQAASAIVAEAEREAQALLSAPDERVEVAAWGPPSPSTTADLRANGWSAPGAVATW